MFKSLRETIPDPRIYLVSACEDQQRVSGANLPKKYRAIENKTHTEALYIVKYPQWTGADLSSVARELICARIGQSLFAHPICPPFAIADPTPGSNQRGFASKFLEGYTCINLVSTTDAKKIQHSNSAKLAQIVVFHFWLGAFDAEVLIHENGKDVFSIDHGFFLEWNRHETLQKEVYGELLTVICEEDIEIALHQLERLEETKVRVIFADIPEEWIPGINARNLTFLADKLLQRRLEVRAEIEQMREK